MNIAGDSASGFLRATNTLMNSANILPIPVALTGSTLQYGPIGPRVQTPDGMLYLSSKVSGDEFVSFLPTLSRPSVVDLDRQAAQRGGGFVPQWWRMQSFVNESLQRMEQHGRSKRRALDLRREAEAVERLSAGEDAAWAFLESAVILSSLGSPGRTLAGELLGAARNFAASAFHTSAAIAYELTFRADPTERSYAEKAAQQWLESVRKEFDAEAITFRVSRALIFAAFKPYEATFRDAARESGRIYASAGKGFEAGSDYLRAAWSMIQRGAPSPSDWSDISIFMETAAEMFRNQKEELLASEVNALVLRAALFAHESRGGR